MSTPIDAAEILDREFLEMRAKLLQVAATFDRLTRGEGTVDDDPRMQKLRQALEVLLSDQGNRAELIQMIFSRPYQDDWRRQFFAEQQ